MKEGTYTQVYVMVQCEYFRTGMRALFSKEHFHLSFVDHIDNVVFTYDVPVHILLVLDMSSVQSLRNFKSAIDFLNQINSPRKIGVLVSHYNSYLSYYISKKFNGKVTFFNSHNLASGLFERNFCSWIKGKTFKPMHSVNRFKDSRYGFSLKEWISLVIPLSGESIQEMSADMKIPTHHIYQTRKNALNKIGLSSYRDFCELYISGKIHIENDRIIRK